MTKFEAPADPNKYIYEDEGPEPPESLGDRFGTFEPTTSAELAIADSVAGHEDLMARQPAERLSEEEKALLREQAETAKRILGYDKK